jgi:hypothetical protein
VYSEEDAVQYVWAAVSLSAVGAVTSLAAFLAYLRFCRFVIRERKGRSGALGDVPEAMRAFPILGRRIRQPSNDSLAAEDGAEPTAGTRCRKRRYPDRG